MKNDKVIGPEGQVRPNDPVQASNKTFKILTGESKEEYIDEEHREAAEKARLDRPVTMHTLEEDGSVTFDRVTNRRELEQQKSSK